MSALKYWLWLTELPGLTNQTRLALLQHFPTPEDVYYAEAEEVLLTEGITREQAVTMLYRYAGSPTANGKLDNFSDSASVSSYAENAMQWAVANGIVNGSNGKLNPQNNATRAEVAAILMRFCEMSK